jgi:adenylate kinase
MLVFSSAVAGTNRIKLENEVIKMASSRNKKLKIVNLVDLMIESGKDINTEISAVTLPNLDIKTLEIVKAAALHRIADETKYNKDTDFIIDGRTSFWWKNGPLSLLNIDDFKQVKPDFFVTILASPDKLLRNLKSKVEWSDKEIDEYEIAIWSEVELYTVNLISKAIGRKNYVMGSKEDPQTLYDLIYKPNKPKVYISYSIEHRVNSYANLKRFVRKLKKYVTVFDPKGADIDFYKAGYQVEPRLRELVFNQTVRRDYAMVDQVDMVVIHLSALNYSSGVDSERMHAHTTGKPVLLYFPFDTYSPFTPYFVDKMFRTERELLDAIKKRAGALTKEKR